MYEGVLSSASAYYQQSQNPPIRNPNSSSSYVPPDHRPNPMPPTHASAPPFSSNHDYSVYSSQNFQYPQNPEPVHNFPPEVPHQLNSDLQSLSYSSPSQISSIYQPEFPSSYPSQQQSRFSPYDQDQLAASFASLNSIHDGHNPALNPNTNFPYSSTYPLSYNHIESSVSQPCFNPIGENSGYDHAKGYVPEKSTRYEDQRTWSESGPDFYANPPGGLISGYNSTSSLGGDGNLAGVYAYEGGKIEPYGSRGTLPKSSSSTIFDDYGRSINFPSGTSMPQPAKIARAVPMADTQDTAKGVQKFRVKLLSESGGNPTDVLCQIGLDGIRMLDPGSCRTLRIYPLENITRYQITDSATFTFWSKAPVDVDARRIRLQSSSYTISTLLDIVTAATVQFKEIGEGSRPEYHKVNEQPTEKKKGFTDWMNRIRPVNEEKDHWVPDEAVKKCTACGTDFGAFLRRHHCRNCGDIFCDKCTQGRTALTAEDDAQPVRVCDRCMAEVMQRLSSGKGASSKPSGQQSHDDLAKKLQEEMEKNRRVSSGSKSDESAGKRMREVECPVCTVHLQVQAPASGSKTVECAVCEQPFLVSAH